MLRNRCFLSTVLIGLVLVGVFWPHAGLAAGRVTPVDNNGRPWTIAYYEGGAYADYCDSMRAILMGLMELGWIENASLPKLTGDTRKPYWDWLTSRAKSRFLAFHAENAFSAHWSESVRVKTRRTIIEKLQSGKIDLVIAMGTWAGQDLANDLHHVPTTVVSTSNPLQAKIIKSLDDSGFDHVTARVDPNRYLRQIRMFHRLAAFERLGVVYEDSPDGRLYSALADLEQVAAERGFQLVLCNTKDSQEDRAAAGVDCLRCIRQLSASADAVYLTALLSIGEKIASIIDILKKRRIPSFSMTGSTYVRDGVLMSISTDEGYKAQGLYDAEKIAKILNDTKPRRLEQNFPDPLDIAINLETARFIGFEVPNSILRIANEIYGRNEK